MPETKTAGCLRPETPAAQQTTSSVQYNIKSDPPDAEKIPDLLKDRPQWVIWHYGQRNGKPTKIPKSWRTGQTADALDPANWTSFDQALAAAHRFHASGIGFVVTAGDPLVAGDLDRCYDPQTGALAGWAQRIIERLQTYTEITPSGKGLRFFATGTLPPGGRKRGNIELYDRDRFLTVTGHAFPGMPLVIHARADELHQLHRETFPPIQAIIHSNLVVPASLLTNTLSDPEILAMAMHATNGALFASLWRGDTSRHNGDDSAADLALCSLLAFYAGPNGHDQVDRLFRQSGLFRPKWDERHGTQTYGERTIERAFSTKMDFYTPGKAYAEYSEFPLWPEF